MPSITHETWDGERVSDGLAGHAEVAHQWRARSTFEDRGTVA
jgi:hypothetical protein